MGETILSRLENYVESEKNVTVMAEIEYRIFILKLEAKLEQAIVEIDTLEEAGAHRNAVMFLVDYVTRNAYSPTTEGMDKKAFSNFENWIYLHLEKKFFSIYKVEEYKTRMRVEMKQMLLQWWSYRQKIIALNV